MIFKLLFQIFAAANIALLGICLYVVTPDLQAAHAAIVETGR